MKYIYELNDNLYINLTNQCTNDCCFCVRKEERLFNGVNLWLEKEPTAEEVIAELIENDYIKYKSIVFCGYGEPTIKLKEMIEICQFIKEKSGQNIRLNTNGQANLLYSKNVCQVLKLYIDEISISLNAENSEKYQKMCNSKFANAFGAILDFARECVRNGIKTTFTAVEGFVDEEKCKKIAENCGANFRLRPKL